MEFTPQTVSELCRDPMLLIQQERVSWMNTAARQRFLTLREGDRTGSFLPELLRRETAPRFQCAAVLDGGRFHISGARDDQGALLLHLTPEAEPAQAPLVSDALLNGMLAALGSLELAAARLRRHPALQDLESSKYMAMLFHSCYALQHRLNNLELMRRVQDGMFQIQQKPCQLRDLCRGLVLSVNYVTNGTLTPVSFTSDLTELYAYVDVLKVELLLANLVSNALKHTPKDGHIWVRLERQGDNAVISVDDDGEGIPPEVLNKVFHAYEARITEQNLSRTGTGGLGLAICRAIAEAHGGALLLESREHIGTSIRLMLPLQTNMMQLLGEDLNYENGGLIMLLTTLSDVLEWTAYLPEDSPEYLQAHEEKED